MRIGIDIRSLTDPVRTGVGEYTYELLEALFSLGSNHDFFLFYNGYADVSGIMPPWNNDRVQTIMKKIPNKFLHTSVHFFNRPRLDLMMPNIDVFFSPNIHFTAVSPSVKHMLTIHDLSFEHFPDCFSWKRRLWHRLINPKKQCERADLILVPSEHSKRDVVATYSIPEKKVIVLYPGLTSVSGLQTVDSPVTIREKYHLPEKYVLFLGTVEPRKNIVGLIEAFVLSGLRQKGYELVIAGGQGWKSGGIMRKIQETDGVKYIGYVEAEDKAGLYQGATLFVYPSLYEGFGFPILEAMAAGTPVVTSNRSSLPEVAGDAAYLANPLNIAEIASAMSLILHDEGLATIYRERGLARSAMFGWKKTAEQFLVSIESV